MNWRKMKFKEALTYDDILLIPQYSTIESRKEVDIGNDLDLTAYLELPIISSPMDTITGAEMALTMLKQGGLGIIHRYNSIEQQTQEVQKVKKATGGWATPNYPIGAAVGMTGDYRERASELVSYGAKVICIDVAHGHHALMKGAIKTLKKDYGSDIHIMAGNVATLRGFNDLADWGADSVRCNIGGGSICSTRIQTGHGVPGFQTIIDCAKSDRDVKIIADGGIKNSGDIVKALAAGADFVMLGSLLAGTNESPGDVIVGTLSSKRKVYRGMASKEAQFEWKGKYSSNEGISATVPYKGSVKEVLKDLRNGIVSGLSYSGARTIGELQAKAKFIRQTTAGLNESRTHILRG
jgi:IMP dehydrogenase